MFYNTGTSLGVIEVEPGHTEGNRTYLPAYEKHALGPWIFSEDLHETHAEAKSARGARWHREKQKA